MKKLIFPITLLVVSAALSWVIWLRPKQEPGEEKKPEAEVPVHVAVIKRSTLRNYVTAYGVVEPDPKASARVAPAVPGIIAAVKCSEGQQVQQGEPLFQLDSRVVDITVAFAEKTLERQQRLVKIEGTSQKALQEAEQTLAAARSQQALMQVQSPLTGVVTKVNTRPGEAADLTTVLAEVVDLSRLVVSANVASAEFSSLKPGQATELLPVDSTNAVNARLNYISAQVDPKNGTGLVRAAAPSGSGLRPGQFVKMRVVTEEHKDCLAVPLDSVAKDATGNAFIALVEQEKAVLKPVKLGLRDGDLVEVEGDGVDAGKTVVTDGAYGLVMTQQFATKVRIVND